MIFAARIRRLRRAVALDIYTLRDPAGAAIADGALTSPGETHTGGEPHPAGGPSLSPGGVSAFDDAAPGVAGQQAASLSARSLLLAGAVAIGGPLALAVYDLARAVA